MSSLYRQHYLHFKKMYTYVNINWWLNYYQWHKVGIAFLGGNKVRNCNDLVTRVLNPCRSEQLVVREAGMCVTKRAYEMITRRPAPPNKWRSPGEPARSRYSLPATFDRGLSQPKLTSRRPSPCNFRPKRLPCLRLVRENMPGNPNVLLFYNSAYLAT